MPADIVNAPATRQVMAFRIQKYLRGLHYPALKPQIVGRARELGADVHVIGALLGIPERSYESPISLSCEIGRLSPISIRR
jgi:hypothetical protein